MGLKIDNEGRWHHSRGLRIVQTERKHGDESPTAVERGLDARKESYAFSKEFSCEYRKRLAAELREIRQKYRTDVPSENRERSSLRNAIDKRLSEDQGRTVEIQESKQQSEAEYQMALTELEAIHLEIATLETQLETKKTALLNRFAVSLKTSLGFITGETHQEQSLKEKREVARSLQEDVWDKHRKIAPTQWDLENVRRKAKMDAQFFQREKEGLKDLVLDESEVDTTKKKIVDFYENQLGIKDDWENTQQQRESLD